MEKDFNAMISNELCGGYLHDFIIKMLKLNGFYDILKDCSERNIIFHSLITLNFSLMQAWYVFKLDGTDMSGFNKKVSLKFI